MITDTHFYYQQDPDATTQKIKLRDVCDVIIDGSDILNPKLNLMSNDMDKFGQQYVLCSIDGISTLDQFKLRITPRTQEIYAHSIKSNMQVHIKKSPPAAKFLFFLVVFSPVVLMYIGFLFDTESKYYLQNRI